MLTGVLAVAAAVVALVLWLDGVKAGSYAERVLAETESGATSTSVLADSPAAYIQQEAPRASSDSEIAGLLETRLPGYSVIARLDIEKLDLSLPVLSMTSEEALEVSVCYYAGPEAGGEGNLVITGHNYANGAHFGRLDEMRIGDEVTLTSTGGVVYLYRVVDLQTINPGYVAALDRYPGERALTLLTCTERGNKRLLVKCALTDGV